jgi:hypothetical protein
MNSSTYTSLSLKLVGIICILSGLIDYIILAIPLNWQDNAWRITYVSSIVERGIVPLVGIVFVLVGYWIDSSSNRPVSTGKLKMPIYVLASILALIFLLFIPFHISSFNKAQETTLSQIKEGATQADQQIQTTLSQLNALSQNPQLLDPQINQLNQVIESGKYQGQAVSAQNLETIRQQRDRLQRLKELAQKPQEFKQEIENIKTQQNTRLLSVKNNYEQEAQKQVLQGGWRIVLNSLMLAIGYSAVSWFGIREEMSVSKSGRSKKLK